jgi:hypothetical protein
MPMQPQAALLRQAWEHGLRRLVSAEDYVMYTNMLSATQGMDLPGKNHPQALLQKQLFGSQGFRRNVMLGTLICSHKALTLNTCVWNH